MAPSARDIEDTFGFWLPSRDPGDGSDGASGGRDGDDGGKEKERGGRGKDKDLGR